MPIPDHEPNLIVGEKCRMDANGEIVFVSRAVDQIWVTAADEHGRPGLGTMVPVSSDSLTRIGEPPGRKPKGSHGNAQSRMDAFAPLLDRRR